MVKAAREAKRNTTWTDPDPSYAEALRHFVADVLEGPDAGPFLDDFLPFVRKVARIGVVHSLAQAAPEARLARGPRHLPGLGALGPEPRRPRQPPPGRLRRRAGFLNLFRERLESGRSRAELARELFADFETGAIKLYVLWTGAHASQGEPGALPQGRLSKGRRPWRASAPRRGPLEAMGGPDGPGGRPSPRLPDDGARGVPAAPRPGGLGRDEARPPPPRSSRSLARPDDGPRPRGPCPRGPAGPGPRIDLPGPPRGDAGRRSWRTATEATGLRSIVPSGCEAQRPMNTSSTGVCGGSPNRVGTVPFQRP